MLRYNGIYWYRFGHSFFGLSGWNFHWITFGKVYHRKKIERPPTTQVQVWNNLFAFDRFRSKMMQRIFSCCCFFFGRTRAFEKWRREKNNKRIWKEQQTKTPHRKEKPQCGKVQAPMSKSIANLWQQWNKSLSPYDDDDDMPNIFGFVEDYNDIMIALESLLAEILNAHHRWTALIEHIVYIKNRFYMRSEHVIPTHGQTTSERTNLENCSRAELFCVCLCVFFSLKRIFIKRGKVNIRCYRYYAIAYSIHSSNWNESKPFKLPATRCVNASTIGILFVSCAHSFINLCCNWLWILIQKHAHCTYHRFPSHSPSHLSHPRSLGKHDIGH